ncbi:MAG: kinase [Clostridia bacterium]|nr:kinase [Clostridia bacterium]
MQNEAKLIILRGNSGSGKSTTAKMLQRKFGRGTLVIPQDTIRREMLWVKDEKGTKAIPLLIGLAKYGKQNCNIVIVEGILYSDLYMELFEMLKLEFNNIYAYYYDITFEETLIRHQTKLNRNQFGENEMKRWWRERDYIGIIPEKSITNELSLEEIVQMIFSDVMSK